MEGWQALWLDLKGRVVVLTGAASGIDAALPDAGRAYGKAGAGRHGRCRKLAQRAGEVFWNSKIRSTIPTHSETIAQ